MQIITKAYGEVEIDERQIITFPNGLFGFETLHDFALLDATQQPFYWLQSIDVDQVAFVLIKPSIFRPDYTPAVMKSELEALSLKDSSEENALVFSIVTFLDDNQNMTANLQGPVIVNRHARVGRQCISTDPRWETRHNIAEEIASQRNSIC
ncbi:MULTISPECIES: flagellar assembly protein FliW [unclassified Oceanispirochaeta]|uniref:flagellar assembly protein FliW n=1 Tax=unclassified Oceanispirochaeta TaxID=2635722 RepID=UPI000E093D73|nr:MULTISPECIES: flagellar assembly protein FliW [unclassified Oceanispirochaeta]MBF9014821.1 flagellar assembly protein FliW [Oceanispirochaeta sp. M2]NPD71077.1 flagellar assembly protein FliW [Oceanispirochaeta sp. M1]RDG33910.1 flagellar assembly protein FliW [Oceanispirochaeta sp. M1]